MNYLRCRWIFGSSLAIRDLTLRSAASFGSFHLIRLLFDEYVVYALEQRTAKVTGVSSLQLFFDVRSFLFLLINISTAHFYTCELN